MFYPECLVALEARGLSLWIAGGGCDLVAEPGRHAVQLAQGLGVALAVAAPPLRHLGVPAAREGLAAVPLAAHAARRLPGQVVPDSSGLLVAVAVLAVAHVAVVQALHQGPRLQQPRLRILEGPPPGPHVGDDL